MTRDEMLRKLGLTNEEFKDLIHKLERLHQSLTESQRAVFVRSFPTAASAAASFGSDVSADQLQRLFAADPANEPFASGKVAFVASNPPE
jgi:hypothetical protein